MSPSSSTASPNPSNSPCSPDLFIAAARIKDMDMNLTIQPRNAHGYIVELDGQDISNRTTGITLELTPSGLTATVELRDIAVPITHLNATVTLKPTRDDPKQARGAVAVRPSTAPAGNGIL